MPETEPVQTKGGVVVSVVAVSVKTVVRHRAEREEYRPFLVKPNTRYFHVTETPYAAVEPERLDFQVQITNQMDRVFRGAGAVISLIVDERPLLLEEFGTRDFLESVIVPRGRADVTIHGPPPTALPDSGLIALFIYDVVTETDDAGNPIKRENFEWYYRLIEEVKQDSAPIKKYNEAVTP
jgi:hypothetical protein